MSVWVTCQRCGRFVDLCGNNWVRTVRRIIGSVLGSGYEHKRCAVEPDR